MTTTTSPACMAGVHNDCLLRGWSCGCACHSGGLPPVARDSDPATSKEAGQQITASGKRLTLVDQVVSWVKAHPGETAGWYGDNSYIEGFWKRLSDARFQGKIRNGDPKLWNGKKQVTWWPTEEGD